jgi:hypothetical protein
MPTSAVVVLCAVASSIMVGTFASLNILEEALLDDMIPPSSGLCESKVSGTTRFTTDFSLLNTSSYWNPMFQAFEKDTFLAQVEHVDPYINRSWRIRIGSGGNLYSLVGAFGEAVPPQIHDSAPFVDGVWQSVAVNQAKQTASTSTGYKYFIHQAGTYQYDGNYTATPFYSPSIAQYCEDRQCSVAGWGQQAHVPTIHKSRALYYNRYRDCGDGVIEYTSLTHNAEPDGGDDFGYLNMPWSGVRKSTLPDALLSDKSGGPSKMITPLPLFASTTDAGNLLSLSETGGFHTFTQDIVDPDLPAFQLPCPDSQAQAQAKCPATGPYNVSVRLELVRNNACSEFTLFTASTGTYTVKCDLKATVAVKSGCLCCDLLFRNPRTNKTVAVKSVSNWASPISTANSIFFQPNATAAEVNQVFAAGDVISVEYANTGARADDALALAFVHGTNAARLNASWTGGKSALVNQPVVQWGRQALVNRDNTVFTVFHRPTLLPGGTLAARQYFILDRLSGMDARARAWAGEARQGVFAPGEVSGRPVALYSSDGETFGAGLVSRGCARGAARCTGSTTPQPSTRPHFAVRCGALSYVGPDLYAFAEPSGAAGVVRPYTCDGQPAGVRPRVTLLGYFVNGSCDSIRNATLDPDYCADPEPGPAPAQTAAPAPPAPTAAAALPASAPAGGVADLGAPAESGQLAPPETQTNGTNAPASTSPPVDGAGPPASTSPPVDGAGQGGALGAASESASAEKPQDGGSGSATRMASSPVSPTPVPSEQASVGCSLGLSWEGLVAAKLAQPARAPWANCTPPGGAGPGGRAGARASWCRCLVGCARARGRAGNHTFIIYDKWTQTFIIDLGSRARVSRTGRQTVTPRAQAST